MKDIMQYRGYLGSVHYDADGPIFYGQLEFIRALVSYEAEDAVGIQEAFHEAVDDYLALCEQQSIDPEKPLKGSLNVRLGAQLHRETALHAAAHDMTINEFIKLAVQQHIAQEERVA